MRRALVAAVVVLLLLGGGAAIVLTRSDDKDEADPGLRGTRSPTGQATRDNDDEDPDEPPAKLTSANLKAGCRLPYRWIRAVHRGWDDGGDRGFDLAIVPRPPNYMGSITDTSHSGPYDFLQGVPLVFYGPGHITRQGPVRLKRDVDLVDVAPTEAALMGFDDFPQRDGTPITEILNSDAPPPKLIVNVVIDGGGWNVLDYWPDAWPELKKLMRQGASIERATVGSSPSITPAIHTNISTSAYPKNHGVTAITVRTDEGELTESFAPVGENTGVANMDTTISLKMTTLADEWDLATENEALVGGVSPGFLQIGMVGQGAAIEGADKDVMAVLSKKRVEWDTNPDLYSAPDYLNTDVRGPALDKRAVDRQDGVADGLWRGNPISPIFATPALASWENRTIQALLEGEGFGEDEVTDLLYINYKAPDAAGHLYNMVAPEQEDTIRSTSAGIGDLVERLDALVGPDEYVLMVTADHGQTPLEAGGWPIRPLEIIDDLNESFDETPNARGVIQDTSAHTLFLNRDELETNGVSPEEVADFLYDYTVGENVAPGDAFPPEFEGREDERIFETVIPGRMIGSVLACAESRR